MNKRKIGLAAIGCLILLTACGMKQGAVDRESEASITEAEAAGRENEASITGAEAEKHENEAPIAEAEAAGRENETSIAETEVADCGNETLNTAAGAADREAQTDKKETAQAENAAQTGESAAEQKGVAAELTMETLLSLFTSGRIGETDFAAYANGEPEELPGALNDYISFHLPYQDEEYQLDVSYVYADDGGDPNAGRRSGSAYIDAIYMTRVSDRERCLLYETDERYIVVEDLEAWLHDKRQIGDWLTLELPEGYALLEYDASIGEAGGALIGPQAYEVLDGDAYGDAVKEWTMSGTVGIIPNAQERFTFAEGEIADIPILSNHTSMEKLETLHGLAMPAALYQVSHDLYTASDLESLAEKGIDTAQIDTTGEYWYIFFASEGKDDAYYLALAKNRFTKEEAIAIAKTVRFR